MRAVLLLLVPLLAGCVEPDEVSGVPEAPAAQDASVWGGSALEGVTCDAKGGRLDVPPQRVQAHLPENLTTRATTLAEVTVTVFHCRALLLDAGAPAHDAWLYLAHTPLRSAPGVPHDASYLLEAGSDRPGLLQDLAARGVPVLHATFQREGAGITLSAPDATYRFLDATDPLPLSGTQVVRLPLLAGHPADTHLVLELPAQRKDSVPSPGVLEARGGVLGTLVDAPVPLPLSDHAGNLLLRPPRED